MYKRIGTYLLTTLLILFFINLGCFIYLKFNESNSDFNSISKINFSAYINNNYEVSVDSQYVFEVLKDYQNYLSQNNSKLQYYPSFEYSSRPYQSKHINIIKSKDDYNQSITLPYNKLKRIDSIKTIFCFGGSTTYGWFVSDEHSWPSLLMKIMNTDINEKVILKNYAVPAYSATQETNQFMIYLS